MTDEEEDETPTDEMRRRMGEVRERIDQERTKVEGHVSELDRQTRTTIKNSADEARNSIREFEYHLQSRQDGVEIMVQGKAEDLKSFQKEFKGALAGKDVNVDLGLDYDVRSSLVIEIGDGDGEDIEEIEAELEKETEE